jgi:hypothetical protein
MIINKQLLILACLTIPFSVVYGEEKQNNFSWSGDFRLRFESDWNSKKANGVKRDSRDRTRVRLRVNSQYQFSDKLTINTRIRTGSNDSHQSPHYTIADFNGNDKGEFDLGLDKWFIRYKTLSENTKTSTWLGRNSLSIWKQNEMFWDDDATVSGIGSQFETKLNDSNYKALLGGSAGHVALPVGLTEYSGTMSFVQLHYQRSFSQAKIKVGSGLFDMNADPYDIDGQQLLLNNGALDHRIWLNSINITLLSWPVSMSIDYMQNILDYGAQELNLSQDNNKNGLVSSILINKIFAIPSLSFKYTYADIGALSVNSSYAQDDWMRWGNATETRATDFSGHEFRLKYQMENYGNILLRLYSVAAKSSIEDGDRFRVDWNVKF